MPVYESRRSMKYGPGRHPAQVVAGDEIPAPVKRNLLERKWVVEVEQFSGRSWAEICAKRDADEQALIDEMQDGPEKDRAQAQLDAVIADADTVPPPSTLHDTRLAKPGDYFNTSDPQAEKRKPPSGVEVKNKEAVDAMLVGEQKLSAAIAYADRELARLEALTNKAERTKQTRVLDKWVADIAAQVEKSELAKADAKELETKPDKPKGFLSRVFGADEKDSKVAEPQAPETVPAAPEPAVSAAPSEPEEPIGDDKPDKPKGRKPSGRKPRGRSRG